MKIILESTSKIVELNGIPARIWEGQTESGIKMHVYITRVAVSNDVDQKEFHLELEVCNTPTPDIDAIPLQLIL